MLALLLLLLLYPGHASAQHHHQQQQGDPGGAASGGRRALVTVSLHMQDRRGKYTEQEVTLWGAFSPLAAAAPAEGRVIQMHPAALCESVRNDGLDYEFGWVGFFKPEVVPDLPKKCQSVYAMARYAMERGATAILVDIDGLVAAQEELFEEVAAQDLLKRPVVVLFPAQATKLQSIIIRRPMVIHARIELPPARDHFDLGIFLTCFFLIVLVCLAIVVKMRWRRNNKQNTLAQQAKRALNKMECRRYKEKKKDEKQRIKVKLKKKKKKKKDRKSVV